MTAWRDNQSERWTFVSAENVEILYQPRGMDDALEFAREMRLAVYHDGAPLADYRLEDAAQT